MPSSPDLDTAPVRAWQPDELGIVAPAPPPPRRVEDTLAERLALFELDTAAGIPAAVLEPARKAAEAAGYAAGWAVGTREAQRDAERDRQAWLAQVSADADAGRAYGRACATAGVSATPPSGRSGSPWRPPATSRSPGRTRPGTPSARR